MRFLLDGGDPKPHDRVLIRHRRGETETQRRSPVETEAETGGRRPPAQGWTPGAPEAARGGKDPPLETLQGAQPWVTLTSDV